MAGGLCLSVSGGGPPGFFALNLLKESIHPRPLKRSLGPSPIEQVFTFSFTHQHWTKATPCPTAPLCLLQPQQEAKMIHRCCVTHPAKTGAQDAPPRRLLDLQLTRDIPLFDVNICSG
jgi:hypothetical protein